MDVREKLVELIRCADYHPCGGSVRKIGSMFTTEFIEDIASQLIANGVTVQEWISVDDRLPDKNTTVIAATDKGIVFQCLYAYDGWDLWDGNEINITHWQYLPHPPKGE